MSFLGLEIARRSLFGHQRALTTTAHNIANISTPGYSRQEAVLQSTLAISYPAVGSPRPGQLGTGMMVSEIKRYGDTYLDRQVREAKSAIGYNAAIENALQRVEAVLPEPSDFGIQALLGNFFSAWHTLAQDVDNAGSRAAVRGAAQSLASSLTLAHHSISGIAGDLGNMEALDALFAKINYLGEQVAYHNGEGTDVPDDLLQELNDLNTLDWAAVEYEAGSPNPVSVAVCGVTLCHGSTCTPLSYNAVFSDIREMTGDAGEAASGQLAQLERYAGVGRDSDNLFNQHMAAINTLGRQIAGLNWEIAYQKNAGANPNDLLDRRDLLLEELGKLAEVEVTAENRDLDTINVRVYGVRLVVGAEYENRETGYGFRDLWLDHDAIVDDGEPPARPIGSLIEILNRSGHGGLAGAAWAEAQVGEYLDKMRIMTAGLVQEVNDTLGGEFLETLIRDGKFVGVAVAPGAQQAIENITAEKAWELAQIREKRIVSGVYTLDNYYHHLVTGIGADINTAQRGMENVNAILTQIEGLRESVSGVNLDEELTRMMQYLYGYQAASRVVSMVDELLDTLINRMAI